MVFLLEQWKVTNTWSNPQCSFACWVSSLIGSLPAHPVWLQQCCHLLSTWLPARTIPKVKSGFNNWLLSLSAPNFLFCFVFFVCLSDFDFFFLSLNWVSLWRCFWGISWLLDWGGKIYLLLRVTGSCASCACSPNAGRLHLDRKVVMSFMWRCGLHLMDKESEVPLHFCILRQGPCYMVQANHNLRVPGLQMCTSEISLGIWKVNGRSVTDQELKGTLWRLRRKLLIPGTHHPPEEQDWASSPRVVLDLQGGAELFKTLFWVVWRKGRTSLSVPVFT